MGTFSDSTKTFEFDCPQCGHRISKRLRDFKAEPNFPCPGCGGLCDAAELVAGLKDADKAIADFKRNLGKGFK